LVSLGLGRFVALAEVERKMAVNLTAVPRFLFGSSESVVREVASIPHSIAQDAIKWATPIVWATRRRAETHFGTSPKVNSIKVDNLLIFLRLVILLEISHIH